jgi:hypothetical protein
LSAREVLALHGGTVHEAERLRGLLVARAGGRADEHGAAGSGRGSQSLAWVEEPHEYFEDGWATPGLLWGYWDDLEGVPFDDDDFVRLDDLYVAGEWIEPPVF